MGIGDKQRSRSETPRWTSEKMSASKRIVDLKTRHGSRCEMIKRREQIAELVQGPLIKACEEFYDKNIRTLSASADEENVREGFGTIVVDFDSLSQENKNIGQRLGSVELVENINQLEIRIPLNRESTAREVEKQALQLVKKFRKQRMTWAPYWTIEELRVFHSIDAHDERYTIESFSKQFFYNKKRKLFYLSEEHSRKANERLGKKR